MISAIDAGSQPIPVLMFRLRKLIREIHHRTLWQVLGAYLLMSWLVLAAIDLLTDVVGLPVWTSKLALVLLMIGLPLVIATTFIQEGVPGLTADPHEEIHPDDVVGRTPAEVLVVPRAHPMYRSRLFTWRNAVLAGVCGAVLLVGSVVSYLMMWTLGIGPVGSLVAQGVLDESDAVLLAEFENRTDDASLAAAVTQAFRLDLADSRMVTIVEEETISEALTSMGRSPAELLTPAVARELAEREGIKAIVEGEITSVGDGYLLTVEIVVPSSGAPGARYRARVGDEESLVAAIDRLSARIREKTGESPRSVRAAPPLEGLTTTSLGALKRYSEAARSRADGDDTRALELLSEAVDADPTFAIAHREMGAVLNRLEAPRDRVQAAVSLAYEHRGSLPERERLLTEAFYHAAVTFDQAAEERAYLRVLETHPQDATALHKLGAILRGRDDDAGAELLLERSLAGPNGLQAQYLSLIEVLLRQDRADSARSVEQAFERRYGVTAAEAAARGRN